MKYLVQQKRFIAEHNSWEKEEDLENTKEVVVKFEGRMKAKIRRQEKLNTVEEKDFKKGKLLKKYMTKILYKQNDRKFEKKYLRKLERNQQRWKLVSSEKKS